MFRILFSAAALGIAALAASSPAQATAVILPAFNGSTECVSGALVVDAVGPCVAGGANAAFTPSPFAAVQASAVGGPSISNGALAFLKYFYTIDGPDNGPVQVDIFADLFANVAGGPNNVGFASLFDTENHQICVILGSNGCTGAASLHPGQLTELETPGLTYSILLEVEASEVGGAGNSAFASADPLIVVDASNANPGLYSIRLSDGVANALPGGVPEPAGWALMLLGFGGVGGMLRSRRRAAAAAAG